MEPLTQLAALANVSTYVLWIDNSFFDLMNNSASKRPGELVYSLSDEANVLAMGLEGVADKVGGGFIRVGGVAAASYLKRVFVETTASYLIGIEPEASDRDGRPHLLRLETKRKGITLRYPRWLRIPAPRKSLSP